MSNSCKPINHLLVTADGRVLMAEPTMTQYKLDELLASKEPTDSSHDKHPTIITVQDA